MLFVEPPLPQGIPAQIVSLDSSPETHVARPVVNAGIRWNSCVATLEWAHMTTVKRKAQVAKSSARRDVYSELKAIEAAFKRVSKDPASAVRFLSKAGIVTKKGRLAKEYR